MKSNKSKVILTVVITLVVLILAIVGTVTYLYLKTDIFKSNKEIFAKYMEQTTTQIENVFDKEKAEEITKKIKENSSESKTVLTFNDEKSEALSKISVSMDIKNDATNKKIYNDIKLMNGEEKILETEYMTSENSISLRLTDVVKQFLTIDDTNLEQLANSLNMEVSNIQAILELLRYKNTDNSLSLTNEEIKTLKETYTNVISSNIVNSDFSKKTDVMLTVNGNTVTANSYILTIKPDKYKNILKKAMEQLKDDTIILSKLEKIDTVNTNNEGNSLKQNYIDVLNNKLAELESIEYKDDVIISLYEKDGKTIRIKLEEGFYTITIDTVENDEILGVNIKAVSLENQIEDVIEVDFTKYKSEYYNVAIELKTISEEEQNIIFEIKATNNERNMKLEFSTQTTMGEDKIKAIITSDIDFVEQVEDMIILTENVNNITLNNLDAQRCSAILAQVINATRQKYSEKLTNFRTNFINMPEVPGEPDIPTDTAGSLKEAEIKTFNSRFETYERENVTGSDVNTLIREVLNNNKEQKEASKKIEITGVVELKATATTMPEIGANVGKTYKVILSYNNETGLIDLINITEN
ncbi:MAG: hypothetical protein HFJ49_00090 [Clostridia bacterium]|nr:hypothetical protein [Clostridia bacterium]